MGHLLLLSRWMRYLLLRLMGTARQMEGREEGPSGCYVLAMGLLIMWWGELSTLERELV
jgi:hypothetical protein